MVIQYNIVVTILNLIDNSTSKFNKVFETEITAATDALLYNNYHILSKGIYILDMFEDEVNAYCNALNIEKSSIEIDEFEIASLTERADIFFESEGDSNNLSLRPIIKCYIYPKNNALKIPMLKGVAYDSTTIIWSWPDDLEYAHYLVEEAIDPNNEEHKSKIIAQIPIGVSSYTETGLEPDTAYTRRLINYTAEQTSTPSNSVTVMTETVQASESLEEYTVPKNYDFTTDDLEKDIIEENLPAFHSGVGNSNDLKVYKQMDGDFYQKFKAYFELTGRRIQREKRYEQVGFNYKICLEAEETVKEQEGEVTFDVNVHPREWVAIEDYMWATHPIDIKTKVTATVFLRKEEEIQETEEVQIWQPEIVSVPITKKFSKKTAIIISVDLSSSMAQEVGGKTRLKKAKQSLKKLIDAIETEARKNFNDGNIPSGLIQYIIVGWAGLGDPSQKCVYDGTNATKAKEAIDNLSRDYGTYTRFYGGLTEGLNHISSDREVVGQIFFTDGFCNVPESDVKADFCFGYNIPARNWTDKEFEEKKQNVLDSIKNGLDEARKKECETYIVFGNGAKHIDSDYGEIWGATAKSDAIKFAGNTFTEGTIIYTCKQNAKGCYYPGYEATMDDMSEDELADTLIQGLDIFTEEVVDTQDRFKGWKESDQTSTIKKYTIDKVKAVTVTSDIYNFTFDNTITPETYSRQEKRAIIPEESFLSPTKISNTSIYDIIMNAAKKTPEWADGYNKTVGTVEKNGEADKYLITGLHIQHAYKYPDSNALTWKNGMSGSVNVFTDIDKANTTTYGDDCYLVSKNNYLMIQGYTDAILYDYSRFVRTELNSYDHASEILISTSSVYSSLLTNRMKTSLNYAETGSTKPLSHAVDVIEKDKDIYFTGYNKLADVGDWSIINSLKNDLIAHNDMVYKSPILNYRFNLEDPDAKTPLYEILPDCDTESNFLNVIILHVYYAKNVYISNQDTYVAQFGDDPLATNSSKYITLKENSYKWTLKEWKDGTNKDNGWYIDDYIWFMAKPMEKRRTYYDEMPRPGMDSFYGLVNGRYRSDNQTGRYDLRVKAPQFNIPTTLHKDTIKIYAVITESYPDSSLVSYKWDNPLNNKDGVTQVNGDYITFNSDNLVYKDVEYYDVISTVNVENQEIFDNKTTEKLYELTKPNTIHKYENYYLDVTTDNSDVIALRYPTEITFDNNNLAPINVSFKGVVNATSQWAPRIHNGYYYINQHEYFAYSEFDVQANFDTYEEENFKTAKGYISFDVYLRRKAESEQSYSIINNTRSELLQNEEEFQWIDGKGLTLKPSIDGKYYKKYLTYTYYSPVMLFKNTLTNAGKLNVNYSFENGSDYLAMEIRSYDVENGHWSNWQPFENNTVPKVPLSCGYQLRFNLQASVQDKELYLEDYLCCYLDWKEDMDEINTKNIVTITDYMTTIPDMGEGMYISKVIDYGCETELSLDIFESNYNSPIKLYIAYTSGNPDSLLLENISWQNITKSKDKAFKARYFRYKIIIPNGEKLYWLRKKIQTLETHALLPYVTSISMSGKYAPEDITTNFINTESFEIPKDGKIHTIFDKITDVIGADVIEKGFTLQEIEYVNIKCTVNDVVLQYDNKIDTQYPYKYLNSSITAIADIDTNITVKNSPYILVEKDEYDNDVIKIIGTPQQFCPITVEDPDGNSYIQLHNSSSLMQTETFLLTEETKYLELMTNRYDTDFSVYINDKKVSGGSKTTTVVSTEVDYNVYVNNTKLDIEKDEFQIYINDEKLNLTNFKVYIDNYEIDASLYRIVNHLIIFNEPIGIGHTIKIEYYILRSFIAIVDRPNNTTTIYLHSGKNIPVPEKCKVYFETNKRNNKFIAHDLSMNPIYRTDYKGFIYLTDEHTEPYELKIYCNPLRLKAGGYDKIDISIEVLDIKSNPVVSKYVAVDCEYGILNCESYETDINGVVHLIYESAYLQCSDKITAKVLTDDNTVIEQSITIINE